MNKSIKRIALRDENNAVIGEFRYAEADTDMPRRVAEMLYAIPEIILPLSKISILPDGSAQGEDARALRNIELRLYKKIDWAFGVATSRLMFRKMKPFAHVGGKFWAERLLSKIIEQIGGLDNAETN